jgi:monoamine oxidase
VSKRAEQGRAAEQVGAAPTSENGISRRRVLAGAAATAAAAALPARAAAGDTAERKPAHRGGTRRADVVVVGAGLAGLTAAREIVKVGNSVLVLEAQSRVGGRVLNQPIDRRHITEAGAAFIGPTQDHILALANKLGVETFKTYDSGDYIYFRNGQRQTYTTTGPLGPIPPDPDAADAIAAILKLDQMAAQVPVEAPWEVPQAAAWDEQSFQTWIDANLSTAGGRFLVNVAVEPLLGVAPAEPSLLFVLWYIACAGNETTVGTLERLVSTANGAQESHFVGGSGLIPERMARRLGKRVILDAPVRRIVQAGRGVRVESARLSVRAKLAIVTVPPPLCDQIEFEPQLPARQQLGMRMPMGVLNKVAAVYNKPFWREPGLSGQALSDTGPGRTTFDVSPPDGSLGVLLAFVGADDARAWQAKRSADLFKAVLRSFAIYFGDQALKPRGQAIMYWPLDPWARGAPTAYTTPGALTRYGPALTTPFRRIHWAGAETASYWRGYMDGAVRSGERAAKEVLDRL